jgi:methionyl-tRNA formyltransferase
LVASDGKEMVLKIYKASKTARSVSAAPGNVVIEGKALCVACQDGELLQLDELQLAGKKRMLAKDFLNGNQSIMKCR